MDDRSLRGEALFWVLSLITAALIPFAGLGVLIVTIIEIRQM